MSESVYNLHAPKLIERGFYPLVIGPGVKKPQHYVPSLSEFHDTAGWTHEGRPPDTSPQPGAGVGLRCGKQPDGTYVVALDWDRDDAAIAAMETFPPGVGKEGARGYTMFYRSERPIPTRPFKIGSAMAVQVIGDGAQTVLPPSIHPDTKRPYLWAGKFTLYDTKPGDLPALPEDYIERIEAILRPLGYEPEPAPKPSNGHDTDNPYRVTTGRCETCRRGCPTWASTSAGGEAGGPPPTRPWRRGARRRHPAARLRSAIVT